MADENTPNRQGLPISTGDTGGMQRTDDSTGQINPPEPEPRPRPDDDHNSDGHHHHEHSHDENIPYSDELSDDSGIDNVIEIGQFQSPVLYANSITLRHIAEEESEIFFTLGQPSDDIDTLSTNSVDVSRYINQTLTQSPADLNLILEPNQFGFNDLYRTNNLNTENPSWEIITDFQGAVELENQGNEALPFPELFEEFNIGGLGEEAGEGAENLNAADAIAWAIEHNRDDIAGFILAYIIGGDEGVLYLYDNYGGNSSKDYYYDENTHYIWVQNQEIPKASDYLPERIPRDFEIFFNIGTPIKTLRLVFIGLVLETENNTSYPGDFGWAFKLVGENVSYDEVSFRDENGDGIVEEEEEDDTQPPIDDEEGILTDNYSTDEEISDNFGVPGVAIEQTLFNSYDPYSALNINTEIFINTNQGLKDSNQDGRIELGLFSFDDDNILQDDLPDDFRENKFRQLVKENLVPNGDGKFVKSVFNNKAPMGNGRRERFFTPEGNSSQRWGYCTYDGVGVRKRDPDLYEGGAYDFIENTINGQDLIDSFEQVGGDGTQDSQNVIGYAGYYPYFFDYRTERDDNNSLLRLQHNFITASDMTSTEANECNSFFMQNQVDSLAQSWLTPGTNIGEHNSVSTHQSFITPYKCTAVGKEDPTLETGGEANIYFPNFAKWIIDRDFEDPEISCYSNNRCLEFLGTNFYDGEFILNDDGERDSDGNTFAWNSDNELEPAYDRMNVANGGVTENQYRSLNQVVKIYNPYQGNRINPFTVMEVKFKMKTLDFFYDANNPPQVEIAIVDSDGNVGAPNRIEDTVNTAEDAYSRRHGYWPHGDFNSKRYSDDINDTGTLNRKYSNFGSMGRFQNTEINIWETFSYKFTLGQVFRYGSGTVRPLHLLVQAAGNFYGRVLLDNFEVYESQDFIPDVDVRKKKGPNNYGKGDLTKYYDPTILSQLEAYQDTTAPLEAQFYFYPQYPSDEVFDVKRTPVYQDFKKGRFYIADVDWGDGTPKEFTTKPERLDEEKSLFHTYENHGVFEVTGIMMRMKVDENDNSELGIIKNKRFKLKININEGLDEDFKYFGSDGFSFIPYKNHTPIIGGYSEQSAYYKSIKRQLGFIDLLNYQETEVVTDYQFYDNPNPFELIDGLYDGEIPEEGYYPYFSCFGETTNKFCETMGYEKVLEQSCMMAFDRITYWDGDDWAQTDYIGEFLSSITCGNTSTTQAEVINTTKTYVEYQNESDRLKTQIALEKMDSSLSSELDLLNEYKIPRALMLDGPTEPVCETYDCNINSFLHPTNYFDPPIQFALISCHPDDELCFEKHPGIREYLNGEPIGDRPFTEQVLGDVGDSAWNLQGLPDDGNGGYISRMYEGVTYRFLEIIPDYEGEFCHPALGCEGFGTATGIPFAGGGSYQDTNSDLIKDTVNPPYIDFTIPVPNQVIYTGLKTYPDELGKSIGDLNITNIKFYTKPLQIWDLFGFSDEDLLEVGRPDSNRYWKNIIPEDYSIYNREGIVDGELVDFSSQQEWLDGYYYPVLPRYGANGTFLENDFPNDNIPFPLEGSITEEIEMNQNLLINITSETLETNVFSDNSGNQNLGFGVVDYKPKFDDETLEPKKRKNINSIKKSNQDGAF